MKTTQTSVSGFKLFSAAGLAMAISLSAYTPVAAAHSDGAIWGIGGLLAGSMLTKAVDKKHESQPKQSTAPAPATAAPIRQSPATASTAPWAAVRRATEAAA